MTMPPRRPAPERQQDDREAAALQPQGGLGEVRAEHAEDADERGHERQVDERPEDVVVAADVAQSLAQLVHRGSHGTARRGQRGLPGAARRDRRQDPAEDTRDAIGARPRSASGAARRGTCRPAGPRTAKPTTKAACRARMKRLLAVMSWLRLHDHGDHGRLRGREEGGQGGHDGDDHVDEHQLVGEEDEQQEEHGSGPRSWR